LAACSFVDKHDPTGTMSADKLYAEAKDALDGGQYDLAIKRYEALEARFPYGRYSQQGQLEIASPTTGRTSRPPRSPRPSASSSCIPITPTSTTPTT